MKYNGSLLDKRESNFHNVDIGYRIQTLRACHKITQEQLAVMLNISHRHMANIESGVRGLIPEYAAKIADTFNVSLDYIYRGKTETDDKNPVCQLVLDAMEHIQDIEQRKLYINTIINLSKLMLKI